MYLATPRTTWGNPQTPCALKDCCGDRSIPGVWIVGQEVPRTFEPTATFLYYRVREGNLNGGRELTLSFTTHSEWLRGFVGRTRRGLSIWETNPSCCCAETISWFVVRHPCLMCAERAEFWRCTDDRVSCIVRVHALSQALDKRTMNTYPNLHLEQKTNLCFLDKGNFVLYWFVVFPGTKAEGSVSIEDAIADFTNNVRVLCSILCHVIPAYS